MNENAIKRIMVGLDGSEGSAAALRWTIALAKTADAEVIALHALELPYRLFAPPGEGAAFGVSAELGSWEQSMRDSAKEAFRTQWCAPLHEAGIRYREVFGEGRAGPVLVEAAESEEVDLIVTGRRGLGSLTELLAGSVSQHLVHRANRPVVVIPSPPEQP
jgi:nucleotide-binding universal stress UspA family protein